VPWWGAWANDNIDGKVPSRLNPLMKGM
jgi:hypothetical protein